MLKCHIWIRNCIAPWIILCNFSSWREFKCATVVYSILNRCKSRIYIHARTEQYIGQMWFELLLGRLIHLRKMSMLYMYKHLLRHHFHKLWKKRKCQGILKKVDSSRKMLLLKSIFKLLLLRPFSMVRGHSMVLPA